MTPAVSLQSRTMWCELQRASGGHRARCALRNPISIIKEHNGGKGCALFVVVVVVVIDTMTTTTTTMRISTRPPLTAASRQDTRTTHAHTRAHHVHVCVCLCACACRLSLARLPYTCWPVIRTSEVVFIARKGAKRTPNARAIHICTRTYAYVCVCACVCMRACGSCVRATRTKTMLYNDARLSYIPHAQI